MEVQKEYWLPTDNKQNDRIGFIRKVYAILTMQLVLTTFVTGLVVGIESIHDWMAVNWPFMLCCALINIAVLIYLVCFRNVARRYPTNMILLGIFTLSESLLVGNFAAFFDPMTVLIAALMTLSVTGGITAYACLTKSDFTTKRGLMCGIFFAVVIFLIFFGAFFQTRMAGVIICFVFVVIYTCFIVIDTQLIVGGKRWELSYDDYVVGALCLYIDIVGLFLYLLQMLKK